MSAPPPPTAADAVLAGWYPDPAARFELRYHNGRTWTADVATDGDRFVDPLGTAPSTPTPAPRPPGTRGRNRAATAAMVLGICALALSWMPFLFVVGAIAAVLAVVFGVVGLRAGRNERRGHAMTGLITGLVGLVLVVAGVALTLTVLDVLDEYENPSPHDARITACETDGDGATASGELTNLGDEPADFSVRIDFVRPGTDNPHRSTRVRLDDVEPGATVEFSASRPVALDALECAIGRVNGPPPFGIDIEG